MALHDARTADVGYILFMNSYDALEFSGNFCCCVAVVLTQGPLAGEEKKKKTVLIPVYDKCWPVQQLEVKYLPFDFWNIQNIWILRDH